MVVWIIGANGMLGKELSRYVSEHGLTAVCSDIEVNILDPAALRVFAAEHKPDWIVNCSAYTAVDKAEEDRDSAFGVNKTGPAYIADIASELKAPLVHISTDYVFDGTSSKPLDEESPPGPTGVYGKSKLAGEEEIRKSWPNHIIIRTAWLYGEYGPNFVYTMLKLMNNRETVKVVHDQKGSPTWTRDLAAAVFAVLTSDRLEYGTYHFSGEGECTWYEFAREIYTLGREMGLISSECAVHPCSSEEFPTKATRPAYSLLSKEKIKNVYDVSVPQWKDSLRNFLLTLN